MAQPMPMLCMPISLLTAYLYVHSLGRKKKKKIEVGRINETLAENLRRVSFIVNEVKRIRRRDKVSEGRTANFTVEAKQCGRVRCIVGPLGKNCSKARQIGNFIIYI